MFTGKKHVIAKQEARQTLMQCAVQILECNLQWYVWECYYSDVLRDYEVEIESDEEINLIRVYICQPLVAALVS